MAKPTDVVLVLDALALRLVDASRVDREVPLTSSLALEERGPCPRLRILVAQWLLVQQRADENHENHVIPLGKCLHLQDAHLRLSLRGRAEACTSVGAIEQHH